MYCFVLHIGIYINVVQIAKRHTSPVLASNMQTRPNNLSDMAYARWKQAQDLCVSLLFVKYTYIPICNTKQYIYKTDYAILHPSGTYNIVNIGIGSICMWWGHLNGQHSPSPASSVSRASDLESKGLWVRVPLWTRNFSFWILSLPTCSWHVDWPHANEIKHDVHPSYIGA